MAQLLYFTYVFATVLGFAVKYGFDSSIFSVTDFVWLLVVMLQIGNDFFELSLIDAKGCEPAMENVDVNDMLCELILANFPNFKARGMHIRIKSHIGSSDRYGENI